MIYKTFQPWLSGVTSLALFFENCFVLNKPVAILVIWVDPVYCISGKIYYWGKYQYFQDSHFPTKLQDE